ncbi:MAG TPA: POTRA domain-containing protein, partial [Chitinophagaceae bacterium]
MKKYSWCVIIIILICPSLKGWCQSVESGPLSPVLSRDSATKPPEDTVYKRPSFVISQIFISGNIKTKPYIIQRELPFKTGDSVYLPDLVKGFRRARELLINTRLFNDVIVALKSFHGNEVDVTIEVRERWYIFPIPYFKPVDRNLQAWADNNYALSRVNYGLKFSHNNFTGRNDKLRLWLITGYTKQVQLNYDQPYADKSLKHGFGLGIFYSALK